MRYLMNSVAVALATIFVSVAFSEVEAGDVTLMSYNIRHCRGKDGKVDVGRTAAAIRRESPDFVGLNEVDHCVRRSGGVDEAAELGRQLGLHATFAEAIPYQGGSYGNAVLSREKPISVERVPLPGGSEPRVLLLCEFSGFWFGTAHLSWRKAGMESSEIIQRIVAEKSVSKPVFMTGDWNANPDSEVLCAMKRFMTPVSSERGRTFTAFKEHAPDSEDVGDYIAVDSAHAANVKVKETHATPDAVTSDHNPVVATVSVERPLGAPDVRKTAKREGFMPVLAPPVRFATYNIHHGEGKDGKYDIRRILDYVESARLDVFGLNEVNLKTWRVHGADTPAEIAQLTGMHVEYAAARPCKGGSYGNAVVSKEQPLSTLRVDLPRGNGENGLKCSLMLCEFTNYWFGSTHLDLRANITNQLKSVEILRKVVAEKSKTKPIFLSGDWNNEPDSITLTKMLEFMTILNDPKVRTYSGFRVRPKYDEYCIDYIAVDNAHAGKCIVRECRVKDWNFYSDHHPVFVTVSEMK